jgi:hypothetical protein
LLLMAIAHTVGFPRILERLALAEIPGPTLLTTPRAVRLHGLTWLTATSLYTAKQT